jgi:hypothetical protein
VTVEGHHDRAGDDVAAALADLDALLRTHAAPGNLETAMLRAGV